MAKLENIYSKIYNEIKIFEPQMTVQDTIVKINQIFHSYDAKLYDNEHPEIFDQLPAIWCEMIKMIDCLGRKLRVLDFGCGTGFEAMQFFGNTQMDSIEKFVCYDLSEDMLYKCRMKVEKVLPKAEFYSKIEDIDFADKYDVLLTNSLLHHLPEGFEVIKNLESYLSKDAVWIAGHEGSVRFLKNQECLEALADYTEKSAKQNRLLKLNKYPYYAKRFCQKIFGDKRNPYKMTALDAVKKGVFNKVPTSGAISKLVDVYIARNLEDANEGMAFDYEEIQRRLGESWNMAYLKTYGFMGSFYFDTLPQKYQNIYKYLEEKYPNDGANFCTVWKRTGCINEE